MTIRAAATLPPPSRTAPPIASHSRVVAGGLTRSPSRRLGGLPAARRRASAATDRGGGQEIVRYAGWQYDLYGHSSPALASDVRAVAGARA